MNAELKQKWIQALRSGSYEQGREYLRTELKSGENRFCCLGVLGHMIDPTRWKKRHELRHETIFVFVALDESSLFLGEEIAGLDLPTQERLSEMNDDGRSFDEIADWIEANVPVDNPSP